MNDQLFQKLQHEIHGLRPDAVYGHVKSVLGMIVEVGGVSEILSIGDRCNIVNRQGEKIPAEIVGFQAGGQNASNVAHAMAFQELRGVGPGAKVEVLGENVALYPDDSWLGRVINALGEPIDGKGPLTEGTQAIPIRNTPPPAHQRTRVGGKMDLGIKAINTFTSLCKGQRMGIFAGSGVGKSTLLSMLARYAVSDINVIGLVGERGREVKEFIEDDLGEEGLKRTVLVIATGDESPLMRRQAALTTLAVAEFFRDQGKDVLCMIDSVTRFAMAQREIGLSAGEPPATKGYTPTVFAELPKLLERAGPGDQEHGGSITGLFTVLVEGDDTNEPISDAVRGILDGHIVLDRAIAERGLYPPINILRSLSRTMPDCNTEDENEVVNRARQLIAAYEDMAEMIRLGAYKKGSDPRTDEAIAYHDTLNEFRAQKKDEHIPMEAGYQMLRQKLHMAEEGAAPAGEAPQNPPADAPADAQTGAPEKIGTNDQTAENPDQGL